MERKTLATRLYGRCEPVPESGCLIWLGAVEKKFGYGVLVRKPKTWLAHRLSWFLTFGDIPDGSHVLHKCDVPSCVNPGHLFLGTHKDNMADKVKKGKSGRGERNCRAKLTAEQVIRIRILYSQGVLQKALAKLFNVTQENIGYIVRRVTWVHV